jgi:glycosyltransferase involved in cell wall biosynthesis
MRVVFLTHNYPRHSGDVAGAFLAPLAIALKGRGHDVRVVAPSDAGRGGRDEVDGIPVVRVRYGGAERERYAYTGRMEEAARSPAGWFALLRLHRAFRRAARAEAAGSADVVVHAHWWFPAGLAAPAELPTVVTLHGTDGRLLRRPLARWLARRALRLPRRITAVSRVVADAAARTTGRSLESIPVQPMPIRSATERSEGPSRGGGGLVVVARLTEQKRVDLAIETLRELTDRFPSLTLTIIGDGAERPALERRAAELGVAPRIRWLGELPPDQVASAIGDADVSLFPARDEGLGLTAVEALNAGVPVVACRDGGGVLDILAEPGAGTVTDPTAPAMAAAVAALLRRPEARAEAAGAGRIWADRLDPARVAERFERWYREVRSG